MKDKTYIFFDLDGTITDSGLGITKSVQYALRTFGIEETNLKKLEVFIGPPLKDSFMDFYQMSEEDAMRAVKAYREYYEVTGLFENEVYEGIEELLKNLKAAGKKLVLATSKPEFFAKKILEHFHLDSYFFQVAGADLEGKRAEKLAVMKRALELISVQEREQIVMIGDRKYDIEASKQLGIETIGVLYGFGSREELEKAGATYLAKTPKEVQEVLQVCDAKENVQAEFDGKIKTFMADWKERFQDGIMEKLCPIRLAGNVQNQTMDFWIEATEWMSNPIGIVHGGMLVAFFDTFGGLTSRILLDTEQITTTDIQTSFLKPVQIGTLINIQVKVTARGKSILHMTGELKLPNGEIAATASMTYYIFKKALDRRRIEA